MTGTGLLSAPAVFVSAGTIAAEVLWIDHKWTISKGARLPPFKRLEDAENFLDGLRKAGLPGQAPATANLDQRFA
jgi:hypothetical protein